MSYKIIIEKVDNGYLVIRPNPMDEGIIREVFEEAESFSDDTVRKNECKALNSVLWTIINEFCPFSDHNTYNVSSRVMMLDHETGEETELDELIF